jgi:hypothetical protein
MTTKLCAVGDFRSRMLSGLHMYPRDQGGAEMAADMYFGLYTYMCTPPRLLNQRRPQSSGSSLILIYHGWQVVSSLYIPTQPTTTKVERRCDAKDERPTGKGDLHIG